MLECCIENGSFWNKTMNISVCADLKKGIFLANSRGILQQAKTENQNPTHVLPETFDKM
jgi:hypothetical protein